MLEARIVNVRYFLFFSPSDCVIGEGIGEMSLGSLALPLYEDGGLMGPPRRGAVGVSMARRWMFDRRLWDGRAMRHSLPLMMSEFVFGQACIVPLLFGCLRC